ncbi:Aspartate 1-decarboxylase [Andreprevotia sp. IGB-42]|uniref:aspartate 1-decarboxylase n=1 Tax=Andreprevotia sp. IGB-42 TaxID=2497473 RepID=UPI001357CA7D|nr:aspartate 1-decarboxylase [Andreprevotia sp. IGB-42]KAF0813765.1 Aspartate 1-decarboxylase [Andreprevotia sp. IGB-42]
MQRSMLKSKIHRATATHAELHYEGSCAIDEDLLEAANIREFEAIDIWNINNGARFSTYALKAARGSGIISVNGSAARSAQVGDLLIIATFASYDEAEIANHQPSLVYVDSANRMVRASNAIPTQTD